MAGLRSIFYFDLAPYYMLIKISFSNYSKSNVDSQVSGAPRATMQATLQSAPRVTAVSTRRAVGAASVLKKKHPRDPPPVGLPELAG